MGQYRTHVFVCASGETCPTQGDVEKFVKDLRGEALQATLQTDVRIKESRVLLAVRPGPMMVVYPNDVWYHGVQESDLPEIFESRIRNGKPVERLVYHPGVKGANKKLGAH